MSPTGFHAGHFAHERTRPWAFERVDRLTSGLECSYQFAQTREPYLRQMS